MSRYDYEKSKELAALDAPFYAIIMTAMRQADTNNEYILRSIYPDVWDELQQRYNAPGGLLPGERH